MLNTVNGLFDGLFKIGNYKKANTLDELKNLFLI